MESLSSSYMSYKHFSALVALSRLNEPATVLEVAAEANLHVNAAKTALNRQSLVFCHVAGEVLVRISNGRGKWRWRGKRQCDRSFPKLLYWRSGRAYYTST